MINTNIIDNKFSIKHKKIGYGAFSKILQIEDNNSKTIFALKLVEISSTKQLKCIQNEAKVLMSLQNSHNSIVQLIEVFEDIKNYYLILEFCWGDLYKLCCEKRYKFKEDEEDFKWSSVFTEHEVKIVASKLISALCFLSSKGVCHRDIKLENILLRDETDLNSIALCDFGFATKVSKEQSISGLDLFCGTIFYQAPEILFLKPSESYGYKCDIFSLGVVCYILVAGKYFVSGLFQLCQPHEVHLDYNSKLSQIQSINEESFGQLKEENVLLKEIEICLSNQEAVDASFDEVDCSSDGVSFIKKLLKIDPIDRISYESLTQENWLKTDPQHKLFLKLLITQLFQIVYSSNV
eukprot:maker-scaffold_4-snap-gene-2.43-mRNA-1 protein AED:0.62 eAED:0.71 QI:0/0/0/0.33/1/1/3/0/350